MNYKKELDNQGRYLNIDANDINEAYKDALADFELQNANYDELVSVLGTPEEFIHNYLEIYRDKIWNEEKPYRKSNHRITESLFHPLVKRSEDGAKFLPQFDPFMTFILILPGIYGLVIIGGILLPDRILFHHDTLENRYMYFIIYEIITGITGIYLSSRRVAILTRTFNRFIAIFITFILVLVGLYNPIIQAPVKLEGQFVGVIIGLELILFIKENTPGFIGLTNPRHASSRFITLPYILLGLALLFNMVMSLTDNDPTPLYLSVGLILLAGFSSWSKYHTTIYFHVVQIILPFLSMYKYINYPGVNTVDVDRAKTLYLSIILFSVAQILVIYRWFIINKEYVLEQIKSINQIGTAFTIQIKRFDNQKIKLNALLKGKISIILYVSLVAAAYYITMPTPLKI